MLLPYLTSIVPIQTRLEVDKSFNDHVDRLGLELFLLLRNLLLILLET